MKHYNAPMRMLLCMLAALMMLSFAACEPQTSPEKPDAPSEEQTTAAPESDSEAHRKEAELQILLGRRFPV